MNIERRKTHNTFETNIRTGQTLSNMVKHVRSFQKRDGFEKIIQYLYSNDYTRVCAVYGLRRTGKTTMLFQAIGEMSDEDFAKTAYVKMRTSDQMQQLASGLD